MGKCDKHVKVKHFSSLYSDEEIIVDFWRQTRLLSMGPEEGVVLEPFSEREKVCPPTVHLFHTYISIFLLFMIWGPNPFHTIQGQCLNDFHYRPSGSRGR